MPNKSNMTWKRTSGFAVSATGQNPTCLRGAYSEWDVVHNFIQSNLLEEYLNSLELNKPDQSWFRTKEWQAGEAEVDKALANGDYEDFDNVEDLISDLTS